MAADLYLDPRPVLPAEQAHTEGGQLIHAASLVMRLCKAAKVASLAELIENPDLIPGHVRLEQDQFNLINAHRDVLAYVRARVGTAPVVTIAACLGCGRWLVVGGNDRTVPRKCLLTMNCPGEMRRASDATSRKDINPT